MHVNEREHGALEHIAAAHQAGSAWVLNAPHAKRPAQPLTVRPTDQTLKRTRRWALAVTILPFLGVVIGIPLLWGRGVGTVDLALALGFYSLSGLGVTVGFHRMLTHRSFEAPQPVRVALAVAGTMAVQGPVIKWVADHRRHHSFSDSPGDPHSPHMEEHQDVMGILRGLWHAHLGWAFEPEKTNIEKFAPDLLAEPALRKVHALFPVIALISVTLPALLGFVITQSLSGALTAFVWAGLVRIFFLHHVTWSINSICHFYGTRPFETKDKSTNNWVLALFTFGEGWHNNHHAFPTSYRHGLEAGQLDPSAWFIAGLEKAGLARGLSRPTGEQLEAKRRFVRSSASDL